MMREGKKQRERAALLPGGLVGWLLKRLRGARQTQPRLALLERITLAPRQSLALVEAEGRRFLIATSSEGGPAFYALDAHAPQLGHAAGSSHATAHRVARGSW